ncbi:MAG: RNA-binding S4 domain-containing protein [Bacteroidales bacterium]|jgi:ribosome-associated protein|nr:RNA-binding S4 domain-containing protein [Bacteroidales bacterium]
MIHKFALKEDYIELSKILKLLRIAETGGHAKILIEQGKVMRNGIQEFRKRAKLVAGDKIEIMGETILIVNN